MDMSSGINDADICNATPRLLVIDVEPKRARAENLAKLARAELRLLQDITEPK